MNLRKRKGMNAYWLHFSGSAHDSEKLCEPTRRYSKRVTKGTLRSRPSASSCAVVTLPLIIWFLPGSWHSLLKGVWACPSLRPSPIPCLALSDKDGRVDPAASAAGMLNSCDV